MVKEFKGKIDILYAHKEYIVILVLLVRLIIGIIRLTRMPVSRTTQQHEVEVT